MAHTAELTPGTDSSGRRFTEVQGPAGGRLFQDPNLATLDRLLEAQKDLPTVAGRRGAGAAFSNFSAFLDLQDRRKVARQNADLRQQAARLEIEKQRIENVAAEKAASEQGRTTGLTPELIALSSRPRQEFLDGITRLRQDGVRFKDSSDLFNLNNANLAQQRVNQAQVSEERIQESAEARTPEAKLQAGIALVERELGRNMTRAEKIRFSSSKSRNDLLQELSEEVEAGPGDKPFTQEPEQSGKSATRAEVGEIVRKLGSTDPEEINAALVEAGFAPLGS